MTPIIWIGIAVFVFVAAMVGGLMLMFRGQENSAVEDRLAMLTSVGTAKESLEKEKSVLSQPLDEEPGIFDSFLTRFGNISLVLEQADTSLSITQLVLVSAALSGAGLLFGTAFGVHLALLPVVAVVLGALPMMWILWRRKRRLKQFAAQLPDALEMIARGLRSGQSLGFGFSCVGEEMSDPISTEFQRAFEEQNLGIPLEETLRDLSDRIPNLDLKFFVTAVILQRQTGGDLAEILDKIGALIRDRFRIWGQVQALTGEGRLSGVVLLALPFVLFFAVYQLNPEYLMVLFTDPMGKQMLAIAIVMQVVGALVIRKIVNIRV